MSRLVLLVTSPRVPAGLLSADAWDALRAGPVLTADDQSPQLEPLRAAEVDVRVLDAPEARTAAASLLAAAAATGVATWLVGAHGDQAVARALADLGGAAPPDADPIELEVVHGSWDVPGARLLDVVATMDRLRSPGGCPWDAAQDHASLAPYLLEEAYEAFQAIEDDDPAGLREELGDVLLQVVFHARLAEERPEQERWTIDDVAAGLVDKLVRRHPHVFGDTVAGGADDVVQRWDAIKAAERGEASALSTVALAAPALTLAATLQRKADRLGVPADLLTPQLSAASGPAAAVASAAADVEQAPTLAAAGELLWSVVAALRGWDIDAETALRARSRDLRERVMAVEAAVRNNDRDPAAIDAATWRDHWTGTPR